MLHVDVGYKNGSLTPVHRGRLKKMKALDTLTFATARMHSDLAPPSASFVKTNAQD